MWCHKSPLCKKVWRRMWEDMTSCTKSKEKKKTLNRYLICKGTQHFSKLERLLKWSFVLWFMHLYGNKFRKYFLYYHRVLEGLLNEIVCLSLIVREHYIPNQKLKCFVLYLKIINRVIFLKNDIMHLMVSCLRNKELKKKKALKFK